MQYRIETRESPEEQQPNKPKPSLLQDILALFLKIFVILAALILIFTFIFGVMAANDLTMKPAIQDGDIVLFYRLKKNYVASDVLVLEYEGKKQIRRVVAISGDTVDITEEGLFINGNYIIEQSQEPVYLYEDGISFPVTVGEGQVFVMGDNRYNTIDSRMYGAVNVQDTLGKVMTIVRLRNV